MLKRFLAALAVIVGLSAPAGAQVFVLQSSIAPFIPSLSNLGGTPTFTQGGIAIAVQSGATVSCSCTAITGATITIGTGFFTNDTLSFTNQSGITGSFSSNVMTLSGSATVAQYQTALQSLTYSSSNGDPTNGGLNPTRTINWTLTSSTGTSNPFSSSLNVVLPFPAPALGGGGNQVSYTLGGSATTVNSALTVTCTCSNLTGATVSISSATLLGLDSLNFTNTGSITGVWDGTAGVLTLSGTDTKANYQTALRSITYSSTQATDVTNGGTDFSRAITWVGINGPSSSNSQATTIIVQNPSQPSIQVVAGNTVTYTSSGSPTVLDGSLGLTCTCANLTGATIALTSGLFPQDNLNFSNQNSITGSYNATTGTLTLSGTDTVAHYQTALQSITYSSGATDPTNMGVNAYRVVTWQASNSTFVSAPSLTNITVFLAGQPTFALTGSQVAINGATSQCWINGSGTTGIASCLTDTRASNATCINGSTVTIVTANVLCSGSAGVQNMPAYTNFVTHSNDLSVSPWQIFPTNGANASTTITANAATDPTGGSAATEISSTRTSTTSFGFSTLVLNNTMALTAGTYSASIWMKAHDAGSETHAVNLYLFNSSNNATFSTTFVLPSDTTTWTNVKINNMSMVTCAACQIAVGYAGASSNSQTGLTNFDVWGAEVNTGAIALPTIPTGATAASYAADNITLTGAALTAATSPAASFLFQTSGGQQSVQSTIIDSNGTALLSESATNLLATSLGSPASTGNAGNWAGTTSMGFAHDINGRTFALNNAVVVKDSIAPTIASPVTLGAMKGSSVNFFTGYFGPGPMNIFNTRIADSLIGVMGNGSSYYFAASGNDANPCTQVAPCASLGHAQSLTIVTNDQILFNGGDTFTGCMTENGTSNWLATRTNPATIGSYGTGQATLTPNCVASGSQIGILNLRSVDGMIINNIKFVGDTAGNAAYGVLMMNCDTSKTHGNITIQNSTFTGINHAASPNNFSADIEVQTPLCTGQFQMMDHLVALNNVSAGASVTATDAPFMIQPGYSCAMQWDAIQGNLIFNHGGLSTGPSYIEGTGIALDGVCPLGSISGAATGGPAPNNAGGPGAIVQFNAAHDNGKNMNACGSYFNFWTSASDSVIFRMNESSNALSAAPNSGCDKGAFDFDIGGNNSLAERNYAHNDNGPCFLDFTGTQNTFRWNVCDGENIQGNQGVINWVGTGTGYVYNNDLTGSPQATGQNQTPGFPNWIVNFNGCPGVGSVLANNIITQTNTSNNAARFLNMSPQNTVGVCPPSPYGNLKIGGNNWWSTKATFQWQAWDNNQGSGANGVLTSTFSTFETFLGETGGTGVNPQYANSNAGVLANVTCISTSGSTTGPLGTNNCPSGYLLASGSPLAAPAGLVLTGAPWSLPAQTGALVLNGQGPLDYYGQTLPCTGGGYPVGASCGTAAPPPNNPVISGIQGTSVNYTIGASAVTVGSSAVVTDAGSSTLTGATVTIGSGFNAGDTLGCPACVAQSITASWNGTTGVLTLSGTVALANYTTALASVTFNTTAGVGANSLTWVATSGGNSSTPVVSTANVIAASTLAIDGVTDSISGGTGGVNTMNPTSTQAGDLIIVDASIAGSGVITSMANTDGLTFTKRIAQTAGAQDVERWTAVSNISGNHTYVITPRYTGGPANITAYAISGINTTSPYDGVAVGAAATNVAITTTHSNTMIVGTASSSGTASPGAGSGYTIVNGPVANNVGVEYGLAVSPVTGQTVNFTSTNQIVIADAYVGASAPSSTPVLNNVQGTSASFTGGGSPTVLASTASVGACSCTTLTSATISIGAGFVSANDALDATVTGLSISKSYNSGTGVLTLTGTSGGTDTLAHFTTALDSVTFTNSSAANSSRAVSWQLNNGANASAVVTSTVNVFASGGTISGSFLSGSLPSGTAFAGGAGTSYYDSSNILHPNNAASHPRFDHNPANGAALGIALEPARGNYWASSNMTASNTSSSDFDHGLAFTILNAQTQTTTGWLGVWSKTTEAKGTGPDGVANSAGSVAEDTCVQTTAGTPASPTGCGGTGDTTSLGHCTTVSGTCWNDGDGGHPSANSILPGQMGTSKFQLLNQTVILSEFVKHNTDTGDAKRGLAWFFIDAGGNQCITAWNLTSGASNGNAFAGNMNSGNCLPRLQQVNINGNIWWRVTMVATLAGSNPIQRINTSESISDTNTASGGYTGDGHSGFLIYGVQATPMGSYNSLCIPQTTTTTPCHADSFINNPNVYAAPATSTADDLTINIPSAATGHITLTFDDATTQTLATGCVAWPCTYHVPPASLNRPWVASYLGST